MNMDSFNWTANNQHTNGQAYVTSNRFASWVTFDEDEDSVLQPPGRPSNIKLHNLNNSPLQDANSNLIPSSFCGQMPERHILDLTPDGNNSIFAFDNTLSKNSVPYNKKNPFLDDDFYGILSKGDSRILEQLVFTRVNMLAFLNGSPPCSIGLNDIQIKGKEVVSRHDIIPNTTSRWIQLRDCRLHECADQLEFNESRAITFSPPVGRRFELLRFRTPFAEKTLPFTLRTVACVRGAEVEMQSWLVMSTGFSSNRDPLTLTPCENVAIRYPIPEIWAKNFRRESVTGEKSLKARFNKGASFGSTSTSGSEPAMRVTLGTAKYEQAFKSVVWRIGRLPDKNSALGHPHTFFCRLELGSDWEVPPTFECVVEVEFDMPSASASKAAVRSLSVGDKTDLKKWITYKSHYSYQVAVEQKNETTVEGTPSERSSECTQQ